MTNETQRVMMTTLKIAYHMGYMANVNGNPRLAPDGDPILMDSWLDGYDDAEMDRCQYLAGGFDDRD